ncbi:olfactory receptor 11L1-like, partial [Xenopus tropicalis]|uniref:Olfactory receptor 11L1-like n=1 Tax=Xenopus tropicalis TaxID=8364 RepID=A0A8J1J8M1_XENTR
MRMQNHSIVSEIFLLGFQHLNNFKILIFSLILLIHILTVYENALVIALVTVSRGLQSPMFFFLQQLSLSDLLESVVIVPTLLRTVMNEGAKIPLIGCIVQLYLFGATEALQCLLLTVMSYDRYLAICNPLRYSSLMNHRVCVKLIAMSWLLAFSVTPVVVIAAATQEFCNQNTINHFFCDLFPLLELSCSDTSLAQILIMTITVLAVLFPFMFIIGSYICIAHEILKIVSSIGRQKAFSTCSSHLAVVSIFYGTLIGIYMVPTRNQSQTINKLLSLLYTVVTP